MPRRPPTAHARRCAGRTPPRRRFLRRRGVCRYKEDYRGLQRGLQRGDYKGEGKSQCSVAEIRIRGDREESNRQPYQVVWTVQAFAVEQQGVTRAHGVFALAVPVDHDALEHVEHFSPGVLKEGERFALVSKRHKDRLEPFVLASQGAQELVAVTDPRAASYDDRPVPGLGVGGFTAIVGAA